MASTINMLSLPVLIGNQVLSASCSYLVNMKVRNERIVTGQPGRYQEVSGNDDVKQDQGIGRSSSDDVVLTTFSKQGEIQLMINEMTYNVFADSWQVLPDNMKGTELFLRIGIKLVASHAAISL